MFRADGNRPTADVPPPSKPFEEGVFSACLNGLSPTFTLDGQMLIFDVSGNSEGEGSTKLYVSRRENGAWTEAKHLGATINLPGRDY